MSVAEHKCAILQKALSDELITAADFTISNCNQYIIELENDGFLKHVLTEPQTGKKYRRIADLQKVTNYLAIFAPKG